MKQKIAETESEMSKEQKELDYWEEFRDKGQHELDRQIQLLVAELEDMSGSFAEMKGIFTLSVVWRSFYYLV